jgi:hypothetical protein
MYSILRFHNTLRYEVVFDIGFPSTLHRSFSPLRPLQVTTLIVATIIICLSFSTSPVEMRSPAGILWKPQYMLTFSWIHEGIAQNSLLLKSTVNISVNKHWAFSNVLRSLNCDDSEVMKHAEVMKHESSLHHF